MRAAVENALVLGAQQMHDIGGDRLRWPAIHGYRKMGGSLVQGRALGADRFDAFSHIVHLQERSFAVTAGAFDDEVDVALEVDDGTPFAQPRAVVPAQHRATPGGKDDAVVAGKIVDRLLFAVAESRLALEFEDP